MKLTQIAISVALPALVLLATVPLGAQTPRGYLNNVPESQCYSLLYSLDLPNSVSYASSAPAYEIDYSDSIGEYDRVAYYLETQTPTGDLQYGWASMDAFTSNPKELGVPVLSTGATFQQLVANMNVVSNVAGVVNGEGLSGNIEFWPTNYQTTNTLPVPGASGSRYDFGDNPQPGGYGSMQIHNYGDAQTVIAFNRWGGTSGSCDVGIGNDPNPSHDDWTFAQNAGSYTIKTLQVLVRTTGDNTAPTLVSAQADYSRARVAVRFSESVRRDSILGSSFALDNGVGVLAVTFTDDPREVVLETTTQPDGIALTLTVNDVRDTSQNANEIAPASTIPVALPALPAEVVTNIGAAATGYELVYSLDIPVTGDLNAANPYSIDFSGISGGFSRIAYYLELETGGGSTEYVWTAMDAFTTDKSLIGVPLIGTGAVFQQTVTNLDVISNSPNVTNVTGSPNGNIEFWPNNYGKPNGISIPNASGTAYDFGDEISPSTPGYGCMQVHNNDAGEVLMALNHFGVDGSTLDVGIGNRAATDTDYTFAANAGAYVKRTLHVMVLPDVNPIPANVAANVTEDTSAYELVYTLDIPAAGNLSGGSGFQDYSFDASGNTGSFDRVAYYMELHGTTGNFTTPTWVWVSMDAFTNDRGLIGVPNLSSGAIWQQLLTNLTIESNSGNVTAGTGLAGNIEFWPYNYSGANGLPVPGASGAFDFGDTRGTSGNYGSMQIHNYAAGETLFAINSWGRTGNTSAALCVGIGSNPAPVNNGIDWTFANNAPAVDLLRRLHVFVRPGASPVEVPQVVSATAGLSLDRVAVEFSNELSDGSADPANFSLDGGALVSGATLLADRNTIVLTTSPLTAGQTYTVTINGVRARTSAGEEIAPGTTAQFTPAATPAIVSNVPDAGMELVYCLEIPVVRPAWNQNPVTYSINEAVFGEYLFDRVGYMLELDSNWAYASFDRHTDELARIGVPTTGVTGPSTGDAFFQTVSNMNVASNVAGVVTGTGITTGNIEFWGENYNQTNANGIPGASDAIHDFGDRPDPGAYGTMQVHNYGASQTILAYNNWGQTGGASDLGIGNNPSPPSQGATDWTFTNNAGSYTTRNLYVFARPGGVAVGDAPVIRTHPCDREVAAGGNTTFSVEVEGDGPFTYQWRCNGNAISGATSSWLDLSSVSAVDVAAYDVVVTGPSFVSTTSLAGNLTLTGSPPGFLVNWRIAYGFHPSDGSGSGEGDTEDKDADLRVNLLEAAFGTDPNLADAGFLSVDEGAGTFVPGDPVVHVGFNPFSLTLRYVRLVDHVSAGLTYTPEYSHNGAFGPNPLAPVATRVQIPDGGGGTTDLPVQTINGFDYEVVEEPFYLFDANGQKADALLGRVRVDAP